MLPMAARHSTAPCATSWPVSFRIHPCQRIPQGRVLYKSFYLIDHAMEAGRSSHRNLEGAYRSRVDSPSSTAATTSGAPGREDDRGDWEYEVVPGGENQRETAFRLGVNLAMYAMCLDYKDDQVHLPFILKRRR